ncbi:MAG: hypothetical protein KBB55_02415 [Candidatus Buchananbacteria bacterium]|nr:hypothetical protein [Candidatus Buchananbacteria bacterium]
MSNLQEVFARIQQTTKEQREIKKSYRDVLTANGEYQQLAEELKTLKARKAEIERTVKEEFSAEFTKLDDLKIDLESDRELLSDLALNQLMKGETVEIMDEEVRYEPVFNVRFKKAD